MEADLVRLLRFWFTPGLLTMRRLTFDSPASLLHSVAESEAVHAFRSVQQLQQRLGTARRLFALFHPQLDQRPFIFVNGRVDSSLSESLS
jgi:malonyl-CoA decarboxylase